MRGMLGSLMLFVAAAGLVPAPVHAREIPAPDNATVANVPASVASMAPSADIKAPWDFAPREQIVVGRDPMSFRKEGTLLAKMTTRIPKVDERALRTRKYAMYDGQRFYIRPQADQAPGSDRATPENDLMANVTPQVEGTSSYGLAWTLAAVITAMVLVAWRKGWFVSYSVRSEAQRVSKTASARPQNRGPKGPPRKVQPPGLRG
jgi:hypothetical protein